MATSSYPDVLLVTMPFGPLSQPAIGLSLLKGVLQQANIPTEILYLTLHFAEMIGPKTYSLISSGNPYVDLAGEWLFADALFEDHPRHAHYLDDVLRRKSPLNSRVSIVSEDYIATLIAVREEISAFLDHAVAVVLKKQPKIVGLTSTFQQHIAALCLAKRLKQAQPDLFIVMGGGNCEGLMGVETTRQFPFIDAVVSGEGEIILPQLVQRVLAGKSVDTLQGVFTQNNLDFITLNGQPLGAPPVFNMDSLPRLDYDDFFEQVRQSTLPLHKGFQIMYETSRGCWWGERNHCTFCGLNGETMTYRSKSADRAIDELVSLTQRYPDLSVQVVDNILDMKYFDDFIPRLSALEMQLDLFYEVKANLKKDQLLAMRDAGIRNLQPGIESLNNHVLKLMKKGVSWLQNVQLLKWGKELDITIYWNILWGFPEETVEDYAQMVAVLPLLHHLNPPTGSAKIRLDRFSPHFNEAESYGFINMRPAIPYQYIYPFDQKVLHNLAYHFFYDYADGRDIREYTTPLADEINRWRERYAATDLIMVDLDSYLLIWDFRADAPQPLTILTGVQRQLYLECDQIRGQRHLLLIAQAGGISDLEGCLAPLVENGLLLKDEQTYLSLAVRLGSYTPALGVLQRLKAAALDSGITLDDAMVPYLYAKPILDNRFFGLDAAGTPVIYYQALCTLIDYLLEDQADTPVYGTVAGITIDL